MTHQFICNCIKEPADEFVGCSIDANDEDYCVDEKSARKVARYAVKNFKKLLLSDGFQEVQQKSEGHTQIPQIRHSEVELGRLLGKGGFSDVFEVKQFVPSIDGSCTTSIDAAHVAVKTLRRKVTDDIPLFAAAAAGLAKEGAMLASLSHQNIIQMKGFSQGGLFAYASGRCDAFFIVLDKLHGTLQDRIRHWAHVESDLAFSIRHRREKNRSFLRERLQVAAQLADALSYLHSNNIMHRDIKPANVGFDANGTVKLFDFDVSRVLPRGSNPDELFHLSQATGTQRYMSPECGLTSQYNLKTDVYSFAILLHEMLSLERPFSTIRRSQHEDVVFRLGERPRIREAWPKPIQKLLKTSWSVDIASRPQMSQVQGIITETIKELDMKTPRPNILRQIFPSFRKSALVACAKQ